MNFRDLQLSFNDDVKTVKFKEQEITVKQHISMKDKCDLLDIVLGKSLEDGVYNPIKIEVFFNLAVIYLYSDITFPEELLEDEFSLYDILLKNGIFSLVEKAIPESEYQVLVDGLTTMIEAKEKYFRTAASTLKSFINDMPINAEEALKIVENFEPSKFSAVTDFAKAANGGRAID